MTTSTHQLQNSRFEVLSRGDEFLGLGQIHIGDTLVRSGRLPLRPHTQAFTGWELHSLQLREVQQAPDEIRIRTTAIFRPLETKLVRDHSFDPIHETGDWDTATEQHGQLDLVLRPANDAFNGVDFNGFDYHYEYASTEVPLFHLIDKASWELDGDVTGATAFSQSACSAPVATFDEANAWTTEGILFFLTDTDDQNAVMTHNLPRFASHGSFDFQFKGDRTLTGVFERVDLIRSILQRDAGKPELKTFDKYIFDQALEFWTVPKKILLNTEAKNLTEQQNIWTWIHCEVEERARQEFGLKEEPFYPRMSVNFWNDFTVDSYYENLIPAAEAIGCKEIFVDNLKKSAMTERSPLPGVFNWNMCCAHEFVLSDVLGGNEGVKNLVEDCRARNINVVSWTNNTQALSSPINNSERDDKGWFTLLEDARQKYGGAYTSVMSTLDLAVPEARAYFVESHKKIKQETGLDWYLFDSFYNLAFMVVTYRDMKPRTMWRGLLQAVKELQDAGVHFLIESFGPFGMPQHGHPSSYDMSTVFIGYRVGVGNDYSTVPGDRPLFCGHPDDASSIFYTLAHGAGCDMALFKDKVRIDHRWTPEHKRALADYHANMDLMKTRYLQPDGHAVLWHDASGQRATLWNFVTRTVALHGEVVDVSTGESLEAADGYELEAGHVYSIAGVTPLPVKVWSSVLAMA